MNIRIKRIDNDFQLEAEGTGPHPVILDGALKIGGHGQGVRPMELLLMGLGGCTSMDVLSILRKMKQDVQDFNVIVEANREKDKVPSLFEDIQVKYILKGDLDEKKVRKAIELSMTKYCSATAILEKSAKITYTLEIINQ
jgi:putative redox protein